MSAMCHLVGFGWRPLIERGGIASVLVSDIGVDRDHSTQPLAPQADQLERGALPFTATNIEALLQLWPGGAGARSTCPAALLPRIDRRGPCRKPTLP